MTIIREITLIRYLNEYLISGNTGCNTLNHKRRGPVIQSMVLTRTEKNNLRSTVTPLRRTVSQYQLVLVSFFVHFLDFLDIQNRHDGNFMTHQQQKLKVPHPIARLLVNLGFWSMSSVSGFFLFLLCSFSKQFHNPFSM